MVSYIYRETYRKHKESGIKKDITRFANFFMTRNYEKNTLKPTQRLGLQLKSKSYQKLPYGNILRQHHNTFFQDVG